jgi:carboxyl-terminal processing protease
MTTEVKKTLRASAGVLTCVIAVCVGAIWRDRIELGSGAEAEKLNMSNLVASTSKTTDLPETKFFEDIMALLQRKYVDPIPDDTKLADGAVRGMIASLGDPNSLYMDADQFRVYSNARVGKYEGIGADIVLDRDRPQGSVQVSGDEDAIDGSRLPKLVIAEIVPGGAADKAGLKPGDWAEFIDDHWVPNSDALDKFQNLFENVKKHKATVEEFVKMRKQLREESDKRILPIKARDRLMMGTNGVVRTQWVRGNQHIQATLEKGEWEMPSFKVQPDGSIRVLFVAGAAEKLRQAIQGKTEATIDLRNNVEGDFDAMLECLKVVAPDGSSGYLVTRKNEKPEPLTIVNGNTKPIKLTILADRTTRGVAEIFTSILTSRNLAKVIGGKTAGNLYISKWYSLPDGAGYSLVTAEFSLTKPTSALAKVATVPPLPAEGNGMLPPKSKLVPDSTNGPELVTPDGKKGGKR